MNPYETPKEGTDVPPEKRGADGGSLARILLGLSGFWWFLTGFVAAAPGGLWRLYLLSAAFAVAGVLCARTRRLRIIGTVLLFISIAGAAWDKAEGRRFEDLRKTRSSQGKAGESLQAQ
jgi:hypothetical protein